MVHQSLFKVAGNFPDPFYADTGIGWKVRRLLDPNSHRRYVGATAGSTLDFLESCRFQLDFMIANGLQHDSVFLDLGCGCLRAGIHFIRYLDAECYLGMDISAEVVQRGVVRELGLADFSIKVPEFVISNNFDFDLLSKQPRFVLANSLFTHLPEPELRTCLAKLATWAKNSPITLFATFSEVTDAGEHQGTGHYYGGTEKMTYGRQEMRDIGQASGWITEYIGEWGHPKNKVGGPFRQQMMYKYEITN